LATKHDKTQRLHNALCPSLCKHPDTFAVWRLTLRPHFNGFTSTASQEHRHIFWTFLSNVHSDPLWGSPSHLSKWWMALSPWEKRLSREADHSLPSRAQGKNTWSYIFTPPKRLHGLVSSTGTTLFSSLSYTWTWDRSRDVGQLE